MEPIVDLSIVCPIMVGREADLSHALRQIDQTGRGSGCVLLISGEAGIGKSRLSAEVVSRFPTSGMVLRGACFEPDSGLPFAPFADLLRTVIEDDLRDHLWTSDAWLTDLARILPVSGATAGDSAPIDDPQVGQRRIAAAIDAAIERLRDGRPLLLLVEDLHWADDASLDLLLRLARATARRPVALVLTYRNDERLPSLDHLLAALDRERLGLDLPLRRLDEDEIDRMLRAIFRQPHPIRHDFHMAIASLTDGNPFFIEEVVRALVAAGDIYLRDGVWERKEMAEVRVPRSAQDAVARRAAGLSRRARDVLRVAAVCGQRFEFDTVLSLVPYGEDEVLEGIRELIASHLVVEESADRFAFRHALTCAALYADLLGRERRALHRAIGDVVERRYAESITPRAAELACHFHVAEDWPKALRYARLAGEHAWSLGSPNAAIEHANRALDAAAHLGLPSASDQLRLRALARATLGQFTGAEADLLVVLAAAREARDRKQEWQALIDLAELWNGRDYDRAGTYVGQAHAVAREIEDSRLIARSLVYLANWQVNRELVDDAEASLRVALPIFEAAGDRRGTAESLDLLGIVADLGGDVAGMRHWLERARDVYRELDDRRGLSSVLATLTCAAGHPVFDAVVTPTDMTTDDVTALATTSLDLARQIGWRAGEAYALLNLGARLCVVGDVGAAMTTIDAGLRIAEEIDHHEWRVVGLLEHGVLQGHLLNPERGRPCLARALALSRSSGSSHFATYSAAIYATTCVDLGEIDAAATTLATLDPSMPTRTISQRFAWLARGVLALARDDAETALRIADDLLATAHGLTSEGDVPHVALLRGRALAAAGHTDAANATLRAALAGAEARHLRPLSWRAWRALEQVCHTMGRPREASVARAAAATIAGQIAASIPDDTERMAYLHRAGAGPTTPPRQANGLTQREREVAAAIAGGLTNREIAEALYIGQRTVETHVANIRAKLSFTTRSQIAVWASRGMGDEAM